MLHPNPSNEAVVKPLGAARQPVSLVSLYQIRKNLLFENINSILFLPLCFRFCFIHPIKLCSEYQIGPSLVVHFMLKLSVHCTGCKDYLWFGLQLDASLLGYLKL